MRLKALPWELTICKPEDLSAFSLASPFFFIGRTDEELSLVCRTEDAPGNALARSDGWRGFRVEGTLDFSLTGILAGLTAVLAESGIGIFAVSTYNTDYILVKREHFEQAMAVLARAGYETGT